LNRGRVDIGRPRARQRGAMTFTTWLARNVGTQDLTRCGAAWPALKQIAKVTGAPKPGRWRLR
jgi:hypothetical protein